MTMNQRQRIEDRRREEKLKRRLTYGGVAAGLILVVAALIIIPSLQKANVSAGDILVPDFKDRPQMDGNALGDPQAPVVIVDYSDFACSHCADFAEGTEDRIVKEYVASGEVYFVYRSVGTLLNSPASVQAAEAAYCAGDQEKFWEYHDLLFANQSSLFIDVTADITPQLRKFAEVLELDLDAFQSCLADGKYEDRVAEDERQAREAGVSGTPSFLVNGRLIKGNLPFDNFQQIIEEELAKNGE
jgi:protein-disulfide isomerase